MHKLSKLTALLIAGSLFAVPAFAAGKGKADAIATVNGVAIPQSLADFIIAEQKAQGAPDNAEVKAAVRDRLVTGEVLAQEAKKKGFDKRAAIAAQIELARTDVLARAVVEDYVKSHPINDEQLKKDYDQLKANVSGNEYKSRHILVEKEEDAKAIIAKLKNGGKFEELAKQSIDPGSKDNGGDLGWSAPSAYVKPFADALTKLEKGKFTETPVKSDFGWHVIALDDSRPLTPPPFEQAKPQLTVRAQQMLVQKLILELRSKAKVE